MKIINKIKDSSDKIFRKYKKYLIDQINNLSIRPYNK